MAPGERRVLLASFISTCPLGVRPSSKVVELIGNRRATTGCSEAFARSLRDHLSAYTFTFPLRAAALRGAILCASAAF